MISVKLMSRRDPKGEWKIRNKHGVYHPGDRRGIAAARTAAADRVTGWQRAEPFTEFKVIEEPHDNS